MMRMMPGKQCNKGKAGRIATGAGAATVMLAAWATTHLSRPAASRGAPATSPAAPNSPAAPLTHERHNQIVAEYMDGKWAELEAQLGPPPPAATAKPVPATPAAGQAAGDRADVEAVRRAMAECRPAWWKQVAAGKKVAFRPVVWGRAMPATFDPAQKVGVSINFVNNSPYVTLQWNASETDNPAPAEHGFSKGDLNDLLVWTNLGMAESWTGIPLQAQANLDEKAKLHFMRYLEFRGNVTGVYYGTPRARRWGLWLGEAAYLEKYAKSPSIMCRRAVGAMFVAEVVGHRPRYPSIQLPEALLKEAQGGQGGAEPKVAELLRGWVEKHPLTLAEDEALREAVKAFATANGGAKGENVRRSGRVTLGNGTEVSLDPEEDKTISEKREEWLKAQIKGAEK